MFRDILNQLLNKDHVKQLELASYLKIHPSQVSRYCSGESEPSYSMIRSIAEFFQIEPSIFFAHYLNENDTQNLFFLGSAIYQVLTNDSVNDFVIFRVLFNKTRKWEEEFIHLSKELNSQIIIRLIKGNLFINDIKTEIAILNYTDEVFIEADTIVQIIALKNTTILLEKVAKLSSNSLKD